jgi:hypothetical protein
MLFNEHLMRLKWDGSLLDPLRQYVTDKEYVKDYVAGVVGAGHVVKTYAILKSFEEVENFRWRDFPCVVKPTHMSGEVRICVNKRQAVERQILRKWLSINYYKISREANYRYLQPKIIVEEFCSVNGRTPPADYKIFCFNGTPLIIQVDRGRFQTHTRNFYDTSWRRLHIAVKYPNRPEDDTQPVTLGMMLDVASRLSRRFDAIRVDMYAVSDQVKVGELTSCHGSAGERVQPANAEHWLGDLFSPMVSVCRDQLRGEFYGDPMAGG